ncbi:MAG: hypothetical protein V5A79_05795, partial [Candidatus Bipolaricaulota bacterium]
IHRDKGGSMAKIVKKFGGTSLKNEARLKLAIKEVSKSLESGDEVIVVVSAMGNEGDPYATDTLIDLLKNISPEVEPQKQDLMMSCGEIISASLFSHYLDSVGYTAVPMTGYQAGIFTDDNFGNASIIDIDPVSINHHTSQGKPVVLAGFQGRTVQGEITTLGRGGSDTTALAIADRLDADYVEFFTDVPGVAVADPKVVDDPKYFSSISPDALLKISKHGQEIIHKPAITRANRSNIPIYIKCAWDRKNQTRVAKSDSDPDQPIGITSRRGFTMFKGSSKTINRDLKLNRKAKEIFHLEDKKSLALVPEEVNTVPENGYIRKDRISTITLVETSPGPSRKTRVEKVKALGPERWLEYIVTDCGTKLMVEYEDREPLIQEIYDIFYGK